MGMSRHSYGTQVKERARQQKQIDKASKRMLARQKKALMKTNSPNADSDAVEIITAQSTTESTD
jgi:hypothetical protein